MMVRILLFVLNLLLPAVAWAASSYPPSSYTGTVNAAGLVRSYQWGSPNGSDDWHNTWMANNGELFNEQDGTGCDPNDIYAHTTVSRLYGDDPRALTCGLDGQNFNRYYTDPSPTVYQEMMIADLSGTIYSYYYADNLNGFLDHYGMQSTDNGVNWTFTNSLIWARAADGLQPFSFLHLGKGYAAGTAPIDNTYLYVYLGDVSVSDTVFDIYLARVQPANFFTRSAYQCLTALDASNNPTWGSCANKLKVFTDTGANGGVNIVWNAGIGRFVLSTIVGANRDLGLFEATRPWGPWKTMYYGPLIDTNRKFGPSIPGKYISADGLTMWVVFSGGPVYDNFNIAPITLSTGGGGGPTTLRLAWTNGNDLESGIASTSIRRCAGTGCTPTGYTSVSYPTQSYTDLAVTPGTTYCYTVGHTNGVGLSTFSSPPVCNGIGIGGGGDTTAPAPPTGVTID